MRKPPSGVDHWTARRATGIGLPAVLKDTKAGRAAQMSVRDEQITAECGVCGEKVELWGPGESFTARTHKTGPCTRTITYLHVGDCADQWDEVWDDTVGDGAPKETQGSGTEAAFAPVPRQYVPPTLKHYGSIVSDLRDAVDAAEASGDTIVVPLDDFPSSRILVYPTQSYLGRYAVQREVHPGDWLVKAFRRSPEEVLKVLEHYRGAA